MELATLADWLDDRAASGSETAQASEARPVLSKVTHHFSIGREGSLNDLEVQAALEKLALAVDIARREALSRRSAVTGE